MPAKTSSKKFEVMSRKQLCKPLPDMMSKNGASHDFQPVHFNDLLKTSLLKYHPLQHKVSKQIHLNTIPYAT